MIAVPHDIEPMLAWGYWLRIEPMANGTRLVDEAGGSWTTLRSAFWSGRLNLPLRPSPDHGVEPQPDEVSIELLHSFLASAVVMPDPRKWERTAELFRREWQMAEAYRLFLVGLGMVAADKAQACAGELTAEGVSALRMLDATRPDRVRHVRPCQRSVDLLIDIERSPIVDEAQLERLERIAAGWDYHFARRDIGTSSSIILLAPTDGPVSVRKTVWSISFPDPARRDAFYAWLCTRVDRWPEWAKIAKEYVAVDQLTPYLLSLMTEAIAPWPADTTMRGR
ncbi:hypothetical protein [Sphingomonas adhaesiva]|uniref:Uncharacterized protein n=1 Tax=Sphingomonas adhaesiva TaxID=28212 RepID=A0A2A4ID57_9SPHN|nr:hypothetical protein [Sphingomonas adhaesiva]PCG15743.1 hypothetical protein COA07_01810 [Sphingomonas adhaesiva]